MALVKVTWLASLMSLLPAEFRVADLKTALSRSLPGKYCTGSAL
jgi:hypothetical protein